MEVRLLGDVNVLIRDILEDYLTLPKKSIKQHISRIVYVNNLLEIYAV